MGNFENSESDVNKDVIPVHKSWVYLGAFTTAVSFLNGVAVISHLPGEIAAKLSTPNLNSPFEVEKVTRTEITLGQEGKSYILKIDKLPTEVRDSLIKQNPALESFLTNGPINIVDVEKHK